MTLCFSIALGCGQSAPAPTIAVTSPLAASANAYRAQRIAQRPATAPMNLATASQGPSLAIQTLPVGAGNLGFEPMVGVDRDGVAFYNARIVLGQVAGKALNEQSIFRSTDAGATWTDVSGGPSQHWTSQDPYLDVDPDTSRVFWLDMVSGGATMSISDDKAASWITNHIQAIGENDHPTMTTAVPPSGSGLSSSDAAFPKLVYYCTQTVVSASCARSDDGGRVFLPIMPPLVSMSTSGACNGALTGHMAADREGRVYIGSAACGLPYVSVTEDGGNHWTDVIVSDGVNTPATVNGNHDVNLAVDSAGNVYAIWLDDRDNLPYLVVSRDHGQHWSVPLMVAPPGMTSMSYPSIDAGDEGRIALSFVGTSGDASDATRPWSYFVAVSTEALSDQPLFTYAVATIPGATQVVGRGTGCCSPMKDFLSVVVAPTAGGRVWASLSDACTGACATDPNGTNDNSNIGAAYVVRQTAGPALRGATPVLPPNAP